MINPWYDTRVKSLIDNKTKYFKLWKLGLTSLADLKKVNNRTKSILKSIKNEYYTNMFTSYRGDFKKTWGLIKSVVGTQSSRSSVLNILHNGNLVSSDGELANLFNDYFINIAMELKDNLPASEQSPLDYISSPISSSLFLCAVSVEECSNIVHDLKYSKQNLNSIPIKLFIE